MKKIFTLSFLAFAAVAYPQSESADSIEAKNLREVTICGEKPQISGEAGMMTVDLPEIVKDKPVTNILESLAYLPGVTSNNGLIWLAGATNVTIVINGELTNMPLQNIYQLLYTLPVDRLERVEVMYAAPAKYHVSGALINVVLKTPRPLDGLQGQVRAGYNRRHYDSFGGAMAATYAANDWIFDLNYGLTHAKEWRREEMFSNHLLGGQRVLFENDSRSTSRSLVNSIYASAAWKTLKVTYSGQILAGVSRRSHSSGTIGDFASDYDFSRPIGYHNLSLRYVAPFGLTIGGDYTRYDEQRLQSLSANGLPVLTSRNDQSINRYHLYADQQHQFGKWQLTYGLEYQQAYDRSRQTSDADPGFDERLREYVADAYVGTGASFDAGLSFNLSLKGEYYRNNYHYNLNFIPQLSATCSKLRTSIFQLNFSSQRLCPSYWELHGGTSYIDGYSLIEGNPLLSPSVNYSAQFNYIFKQKYAATLYIQYDDKASVQLPYQLPDEPRLLFQTVNMNFKRVFGLNLHVPFDVGNIWSATVTLNGFHQREKADHFHNISFDNARWIFYGLLNNTIRFGAGSPLALTVEAAYISPSLQGIADLSAMWKIDAGVKWQFGCKRCCEVVLEAKDIFNSWSPTMTIGSRGQDYRMKVHDMTRNLKLTFIWRFNGFTPKNNTDADTSRFGTGK